MKLLVLDPDPIPADLLKAAAGDSGEAAPALAPQDERPREAEGRFGIPVTFAEISKEPH